MLRLQNLVRQREALRLQRLQLLQRQRRLRLFFRLLCNSPPRAKNETVVGEPGRGGGGQRGLGERADGALGDEEGLKRPEGEDLGRTAGKEERWGG